MFRVTLPNIKWGLLYGVILRNSRAMGEFGAVSVDSGHVRGETNTMPLHVEVLCNEYQLSSAFAVADRVVVLDRGRVQQAASPRDIRRAPANAFVADFIGIPYARRFRRLPTCRRRTIRMMPDRTPLSIPAAANVDVYAWR